MLVLASLLFPGALADVAVCNGVALSDTVPAPGAEGVPLDVRIGIVFDANTCASSNFERVVLKLAEDESKVATETTGLDDLDATHLAEVFPTADLLPDTAYVLELDPIEGAGELVSVGFTTGTTLVEGLTGEPTLSVQYAQYNRSRRVPSEIEMSWSVKAAQDPDTLSVLQIKDSVVDRGIQSFAVPETGATERTLFWRDGERPDEVCPQVRQIDGTGVATEWSEPVCVNVAGGCGGCATGDGAGAGIVGMVAALGMLARRRR